MAVLIWRVYSYVALGLALTVVSGILGVRYWKEWRAFESLQALYQSTSFDRLEAKAQDLDAVVQSYRTLQDSFTKFLAEYPYGDRAQTVKRYAEQIGQRHAYWQSLQQQLRSVLADAYQEPKTVEQLCAVDRKLNSAHRRFTGKLDANTRRLIKNQIEQVRSEVSKRKTEWLEKTLAPEVKIYFEAAISKHLRQYSATKAVRFEEKDFKVVSEGKQWIAESLRTVELAKDNEGAAALLAILGGAVAGPLGSRIGGAIGSSSGTEGTIMLRVRGSIRIDCSRPQPLICTVHSVEKVADYTR